jgi:hypothetical protein
MTNIILTLENVGKPIWLIIGIISLGVVAFFDYITGAELSFSLFYLIPIFIFSWSFSGNIGGIIAFLSAIIWVVIEILTDTRESNAFVYLWNAVIRFGFFLLPALLLKSLEQERKHARTDYLTGALTIDISMNWLKESWTVPSDINTPLQSPLLTSIISKPSTTHSVTPSATSFCAHWLKA